MIFPLGERARSKMRLVPSQVLRVVGGSTLCPRVGIERIPGGAAELFQGFVRCRRILLARREHDAPMSGGKHDALGREGVLLLWLVGHAGMLSLPRRQD